MTPERGRPEQGEIGGLDALVFGTVAFVVALLAWVSAWRVLDAAQAASTAANAGLAQALRADGTDQARRLALHAATAVLRAEGYGTLHPVVTLEGRLARCARVEVTVGASVPLVRLPLLGTPATVEVQGRAGGLVDPFAPGLGGTDTCA